MEEILYQLRLVVDPIKYKVLNMPGGWEWDISEPSTVAPGKVGGWKNEFPLWAPGRFSGSMLAFGSVDGLPGTVKTFFHKLGVSF